MSSFFTVLCFIISPQYNKLKDITRGMLACLHRQITLYIFKQFCILTQFWIRTLSLYHWSKNSECTEETPKKKGQQAAPTNVSFFYSFSSCFKLLQDNNTHCFKKQQVKMWKCDPSDERLPPAPFGDKLRYTVNRISLTSNHPSYATTFAKQKGWSHKRRITVKDKHVLVLPIFGLFKMSKFPKKLGVAWGGVKS